MKWLVLTAVVLFSSLGWAQTWYYNVDQDTRLDPDTVNFAPTANDMLCAALLESGTTPAGGATVSNLSLPPFCPSDPPVVVWGTDPDSGDTVYAALLVVKFWGKNRANNGNTGTDRLISVIKQSYGFEVDASGDLDQADGQFSPPFTTPPVSSPVAGSGWQRWQSSQDLSLLDPQVSDVQNHGWWNSTCQQLYGYGSRCWSAVFTWALPVRLVVHGGEKGSYQLTLEPKQFVQKTAATLGVQGGELTRPSIVPWRK